LVFFGHSYGTPWPAPVLPEKQKLNTLVRRLLPSISVRRRSVGSTRSRLGTCCAHASAAPRLSRSKRSSAQRTTGRRC